MEICICVGSACHVKGSQQIIKRLEQLIKEHNLEEKIIIKGSFCLGKCSDDVSIKIDGIIKSVKEEQVDKFFYENLLRRLK